MNKQEINDLIERKNLYYKESRYYRDISRFLTFIVFVLSSCLIALLIFTILPNPPEDITFNKYTEYTIYKTECYQKENPNNLLAVCHNVSGLLMITEFNKSELGNIYVNFFNEKKSLEINPRDMVDYNIAFNRNGLINVYIGNEPCEVKDEYCIEKKVNSMEIVNYTKRVKLVCNKAFMECHMGEEDYIGKTWTEEKGCITPLVKVDAYERYLPCGVFMNYGKEYCKYDTQGDYEMNKGYIKNVAKRYDCSINLTDPTYKTISKEELNNELLESICIPEVCINVEPQYKCIKDVQETVKHSGYYPNFRYKCEDYTVEIE